MQRKVSRFHSVGKLLMVVLLGTALVGLWGCGGDTTTTDTSTTVTNPNPDNFQPTGHIQGVIRDAVTGAPLAGALVSIDVPGSSQVVVTTQGDGQYSFTDVPASTWSDANGDGVVQFGELSTYTVTVDLTPVNAALPAGATPYPDFAFGPAAVGFASFLEGNAPACPNTSPIGGNTGNCVEGGSGANTPVDGLTTTLNFDIGALTDTIRGKVLADSNHAPLAGVRVTLFDSTTPGASATPNPGVQPLFPANAIRLSLRDAVAETDANGEFSFTGVSGVHTFAVMAESAPNWNPVTTAAFTTPGGGATTLVPATAAVGAVSAPGTGEIILTRVAPGMDTAPPYVVSATPADGADIDVTAAGNNQQSFVLVFNESLSTDAFEGVTAAVTDFKGITIGAVPGTADGTVAVDVAFSTTNVDNDTVTITPIGTWKEGLTYGLFLAGLRDTAGNLCCGGGALNALNTPVFGEVAASPATLLFTTKATGGPIPGPAVAQAASSTDFNSTMVTLEWGDEIARREALPEDDPQHIDAAQIRAYQVFAAIRPDLGGDFQQIWQSLPSNEPTTSMGPIDINDIVGTCISGSGITGEDGVCREILEDSIKDVGDDIDGDAATADFSDGFNSVSFAVRIINANGVVGSLGTALAAQDNTPPTSVGQVLTDTDGDGVADTVTITMSEPLKQTSAENTDNYALYDAEGNDVTAARGVQFTAAALENDGNGDGIKGMPLDADVTITLSVASIAGGGPDIRNGDYVQLSNVQDLAAVPNTNEPVDGTAVANQLVDMTAPRLTGGSVSSIVATFNEPMGMLTAIPTVRIAGVDCTANNQVTVEGFPTFPADLNGATSVTLNVDPAAGAANPACDTANLDENSSVSFEGLISDVAGNVIDDDFDHLDGANLEVAADPPVDTTPPTLDAVSSTDNAAPDKDTITLTFSEPLGAFALTSVTVGVVGPNNTPVPCPGTFITNDFAPGATQVTLTLTPGPAGVCDLANLADGNSVQLDAANTTDTGFPTPNPLSGDNDSATFDGTDWVVEQPAP